MNKSLKRLLLLFALICVFVCGTVFAVACTDGGGSGNGTITGGGEGGDGEETVTYSVTVTTESNVDLTTLKVQWMSGTTEASEKIALSADGKASAELDSGNYTVVLSGYDTAKYTAEDASVTATAPGATIVLTAKTHTVTVVVTNSTGVDIPADVKAQLYNGTQTVGSPVALTQIGAAITGVPYGSSYTVGLIGLPDYFAAVAAKPVGDESTVTFELTLATVDYKINVAVTGEDAHAIADTLTVAFYKDDTVVEGFDEVEVKDGVATASLLAGAYTVKVNGLDAAVEGAYYECDDVTVSITEHTATVTLTKIIYTITLEELPVNIQKEDIANLTVTFGSGITAVAFVEGTAEISAPAASYSTVTLAGSQKSIDGVLTEALTAENKESGLRLGLKNTPFVNPGDFVITTGADGTADISVTGHTPQDQPEVTELLYTFKWEVFGSGDSIAVGNTSGSDNPITFVSGEISYILRNSQRVEFSLNHTPTGVHKFILNLAVKAAPAKGDIMNPIDVSAIDGVYTLPEGSELTEAYFRLPTLSGNKTYDLKSAGEGVEVYSLGTSPMKNPPETLKVENGGSMNLVPWDVYNSAGTLHNYVYAKLSDTAEPGTVLTFEVEVHLDPGASPAKPIVLQLDIAAEHTFPNDNSGKPVWFSFTPSEAGDYRFSEANDNQDFNYTVYGGFEGEGATATGKDPVTVTGGRIPLEEDHTYYISVDYIYWMKITVTISKYVALPGEKDNPIEASETGDTPNTVEIKFGENVYFKHTVKTESLNEDGDFVLEFDPHPSALESVFYKDSTYSGETYDTLGYNIGDDGKYSTTIHNLHVGDVVYFYIKANTTSATFYINRPEVIEKEDEIEVGKTVTYSHNDSGGVAMSTTFSLASSVQPGEYILEYSVDPNPYIYGKINVTVGSFSVSYPDSGTIPVTGSLNITIPAGATSIQISTTTGAAPATYVWSFTLKVPEPELDVGENQTFDLTTSTTTIKVVAPAGTYTLGYHFSVMGMFGFSGGNVNNTFQQDGSTEITFEEGDVITITNFMSAPGVTVTFTLTAVGGAEGTELTVGTPTEVTITPDESSNVNLTITLSNVPAGTYNFEFSTESAIFLNLNNWYVVIGQTQVQFAKEGDGYIGPVQITIPDDCTEISITSSGIGAPLTATITLTAVGGGTGPVVPPVTKYDITVGESAEVTMPANYLGANKTVYLEAGTYTITVTGDNLNSVSIEDSSWVLGNFGIILEAGAARTATLTVAKAGEYTLTFKDTSGKGTTVSVLITAGGSQEGADLTVGESAEVVIPSGYDGVDKTVYLEAGTYTVTVTGDSENVVAIGEVTGTLGEYGTILNPDGERVAMFTVETAGQYTLNFQDTTSAGLTINVLIEVSEESEEGDLTLGEAGTVTLTGIGSPEEVIKTIQLEEGWYTVTIEGDMANVMVVDSLGDTIVARTTNSGKLHVEVTGLVELTFRYFGTAPLSLTVTITAQ